MEKKYYTLNQKKKTITIDYTVKPTKEDETEVNAYILAGYIIKRKSAKRAAAAAKRANDGLKGADIEAALKGNEEALAEYASIKSERGFFAAKKWYKDNYLK